MDQLPSDVLAVDGVAAPSAPVRTVWPKPWLPAAAAAAACACAAVGLVWASMGGGGGGAGVLGGPPKLMARNLSEWLETVVCGVQLVHVQVGVIIELSDARHWFITDH